MPWKYSRKVQSKLHHFFLRGFRGLRKSQGEDAAGDCLFLLEQAVFKREEKKCSYFQNLAFSLHSLPAAGSYSKTHFLPQTFQCLSLFHIKKHDICFLFNILFKVTANFLNFQHFPLVASAGEHRTNLSRFGCQEEAQGPVAGL